MVSEQSVLAMAEGTWSDDVKKLEALIRDSVRESEQRQEKLWRESEEKFEKLFFEMKSLITGLSIQPVEFMNKLSVEISSANPVTQGRTCDGEALSEEVIFEAKEEKIPNSQASAVVAEELLSLSLSLSRAPSLPCCFTIAEPVENFNSAATADDDVKFGFQRPEMYQSNLTGTVDPYHRHVFFCFKTHESWPPCVEDSKSDSLPKLLSAALKDHKDDIKIKTRSNEGCEGTEFSDGDVMIFSKMIKYMGLKDLDADNFVEDVLENGKPWASGLPEVLTGSHVFVCAHASRDQRCGVCGPALIEKFKEEIELRELKEHVFVSACSHVGGHKYPRNLIIFSADQQEKTIEMPEKVGTLGVLVSFSRVSNTMILCLLLIKIFKIPPPPWPPPLLISIVHLVLP